MPTGTMSRVRNATSSLTITDPLVKYQALVATGVYSPDSAQHRLAHHLQKLYIRLKDYTPAPVYATKLGRLTRSLGSRKDETESLAVESHPIWRNPLFSRFFQATEGKDSLALTRALTSHQAALDVDSPRGLFLSGEVGTGKSMLLDLLSEGLPTNRKRRWHFNTFMLYAFSRLEHFRTSTDTLLRDEKGYSLLWLASEMVEQSPILFLDEFQLPDRAASKILNNLLIAFFQMGGVLIASSNRMPEELEKATGSQYTPQLSGGLVRQLFGLGPRRQGELFGQTSDFAVFLEVLKARCDFWHMEGVRDWRRREHQNVLGPSERTPQETSFQETASSDLLVGAGSATHLDIESQQVVSDQDLRPAMYAEHGHGEEVWRNTVANASHGIALDSAAWKRRDFVVYGRVLTVPRQHDRTCLWNFSELVHSHGPADYLTLSSHYNTFIVDHVPVLPLAMKNEARRFITFLDALYEARCKLVIRAAGGPDDLFFPETKMTRGMSATLNEASRAGLEDATYSETIAEVYQDQMAPFRPNISTYNNTPNEGYSPDQDSDFGREQHKNVNFSNTGAFTGEDERFAYKRAASRLWEMCSIQWHARTGDWWQPLPPEVRHWEGSEPTKPLTLRLDSPTSCEITLGPSEELEEPVGLERHRVTELKNSSREA